MTGNPGAYSSSNATSFSVDHYVIYARNWPGMETPVKKKLKTCNKAKSFEYFIMRGRQWK